MAAQPRTVSVHLLREHDLPEADRILRDAFETFTGIRGLFADKDYVRTRWAADPARAIGAELDGKLAGSNFVTLWGSLGFFGPLSVRPSLWDTGIGKALMEATHDLLAAVRHAALFTFSNSPKHHAFYQRFGFWPRFVTPVLLRPIASRDDTHADGATRFSELTDAEQSEALDECRKIANRLFDGLDLSREIRAIARQKLGDTVLVRGDRIEGFAACHVGAGTEAGGGGCFVKFGALRPGLGDAELDRLIDACDRVGAERGATTLEVGVNAGCHEAYRRLAERGFRAALVGVAMQRPNEPAYNRPGLYVLGDWR